MTTRRYRSYYTAACANSEVAKSQREELQEVCPFLHSKSVLQIHSNMPASRHWSRISCKETGHTLPSRIYSACPLRAAITESSSACIHKIPNNVCQSLTHECNTLTSLLSKLGECLDPRRAFCETQSEESLHKHAGLRAGAKSFRTL